MSRLCLEQFLRVNFNLVQLTFSSELQLGFIVDLFVQNNTALATYKKTNYKYIFLAKNTKSLLDGMSREVAARKRSEKSDSG